MSIISAMGHFFVMLQKFAKMCISKYNTRILFHGNATGTGYIGAEVSFKKSQNISIGKNSYMNGGQLYAEGGHISIGENCLISYNVHIRTDMHNYKSREICILQQGHSFKDISIGNDVWIGYGAQILSGVVVADGSVIAAGAVLTKSTEPYGVYAGVPAKKIGERT